MKSWSRRLPVAAAAITVGVAMGIFFSGHAAAQAPAATATKGKTAGETFKNVTTSTLKGLTPDDFLSAMGVMADSLGLDCADCHPGAGSDKVDWVFDTPAKKTARKMVEMVATINKTNFNGVQMVTCYTCHHARDRPSSTVSLDQLYSTPNNEPDDVVANAPGAPPAAQVLDKYIAALGGAAKLNTLTSYVATGKSVGYEGLGGDGDFVIYAKSPDQRTTQISFKDHPDRGTSTWTYNGKTGWVTTPRGLLGEFEITGGNIDGTRFEAMLGFPGQIKTLFTTWRSGGTQSIGDKDFQVIQGSGPRGLLATLLFDTKTNLLVRMIRYTNSPIGRVPTQIDYDNYKDVNGIKFPMEVTFLWLDGRYTAKISDVKVNVAIDAAKFGKP
ncbi:MAG TPA: photosynthetic reaction center cytochrome c subunit family protein [Bryobacteraceae bacterium]